MQGLLLVVQLRLHRGSSIRGWRPVSREHTRKWIDSAPLRQSRVSWACPPSHCANDRLRVGIWFQAWSSLPRRWLPEFNFVALGIHDPTKLSVIGVVRLLQDVTSFVPKRVK